MKIGPEKPNSYRLRSAFPNLSAWHSHGFFVVWEAVVLTGNEEACDHVPTTWRRYVGSATLGPRGTNVFDKQL